MTDRVSTYPGRIQLEPVSGSTNIYQMTRADNPISEGTPLNKATLLTDATAALVGLGEDATPDDMLAILANKTNNLQTTVQENTNKLNGQITYGTTALTAGSSNLTTGYIYIQYE